MHTAILNNNNNAVLADVFCCPKCHKTFSKECTPINLACGHLLCVNCISSGEEVCPQDQISFAPGTAEYPLNLALLSILGAPVGQQPLVKRSIKAYAALHRLLDAKLYERIEQSLLKLASFFHRPTLNGNDGRGDFDDVGADVLSRAVQRKLMAILCCQIVLPEGITNAFCSMRAIAERVLSEVILSLQNSTHFSSHLWSAVRARGCQFLGPTMQEDVLRLILSALSKGELIARKTLVMYIVQTLSQTYPHVSKTCVGHVVQLAYRASCFNVIKRDGESSLMQLKEEFRDYSSLRYEHDSQIVQIAFEAGLRISPDQWSSLLYGDLRHRSHMQLIVDRVSSPQLLSNAVSELHNILKQQYSTMNGSPTEDTNCSLLNIFDFLRTFEVDDENLKVDACLLDAALSDVKSILDIYVDFMKHRMPSRILDKKSKKLDARGPSNGLSNSHLYKTRLCRDVSTGKMCPHGENCTYAHGMNELRNGTISGGRFGSAGSGLLAGNGLGSMCSSTCVGGQFRRSAAISLNAHLTNTNNEQLNGTIVDTTAPSNEALIATQLQAQTAAQPPPLLPPPLVANMVDGNVTTLTPLITQGPAMVTDGALTHSAQPPMMGAIDSMTGGFVNLIPMQNFAGASMTTERVENIMVEPISLVPVMLQPQSASYGGESIMEQQLQQSAAFAAATGQNVLLVNQTGLVQLQQNTADESASFVSLNNSSILVMPPAMAPPPTAQQIQIIPTTPAGGPATIVPIPMGAISATPPGAGIIQAPLMNPFQNQLGGPTIASMNCAPSSAIVPGFIMNPHQNFWSNDSCAKNDSGDESFFTRLSATSKPIAVKPGNSENTRNAGFTTTSTANSGCATEENEYGSGASSAVSNEAEEGHLFLRRNEIISHLADMRPASHILEDFFDYELENHVSYTVANSVLFEEKEAYCTTNVIDLPPLPIGSFKSLNKKASASQMARYNTFSPTFGVSKANPITTTYLRTACPNSFSSTEETAPATVQAGCKNVVKDAIGQPLVVSSLQNLNLAPHTNFEMMDPFHLVEQLPTVIKPLSTRIKSDPQDLVALSLDRIVDVKERINEAKKGGGAISSAVEKEQLKVELGIANRQISTLDEQTKESCLLKELKAVDQKIENLNVSA